MTDFFGVLIPFLLIHIICDFYLQPDSWIEAKKAHTYRSSKLYLHSVLHGVGLILPALVLNIDWRSTLCLVVIVAVTHFVIDLWKVTTPKGNNVAYFVIDQALHVLVLAAIAFHVTDGVSIDAVLQHEHFSNGVLVVCAYLLILKPTSIVISAVLNKYPIVNPVDVNEVKTEAKTEADTQAVTDTQALTDTQTVTQTVMNSAAAPVTSVSPAKDESTNVSGLVAGGELIGYLERLLILTFTLVGSYAAVGVVLAAKSIFRFGELNQSANRSMTEYVLIGSLLSVVITTLIGAIVSLGLGVKLK
ncbi:DUF3307 domain-containing protein [Shewanella inventionis]|uniref:DUF3307 domain-containing protein n=1 Tax=Shewanella inventionis TaxID=1738770 RepID=A0ABQ1JI88_9GAMM|nr:DUF3307 domain-containing protein [Shewanella inventionis]MCL1159204.1 DUF3307 domain-containing protein [Shewanella inventionis]GGB67455.1 hypothetical protein GCM10011607_30110 [Shewanella inventionis]